MNPDPDPDRDNAIRLAAKILAKAVLLDPRMSSDDGVILAWAEVLAPHRFTADDALPAVVLHYTTSRDRIMPADVVRLAREHRTTTRAAAAEHRRRTEQLTAAPASAQARQTAIAAACATIGARHAADTTTVFPARPRERRVDSLATIRQKVARARTEAPPQALAELPDDEPCDWNDQDGRPCIYRTNHLTPHQSELAAW